MDRAKQSTALFVPQKLRLAREARGMPQSELAESIVSAAAISQYEKGRSKPSAEILLRLAAKLGFPLDFFLAGGSPASAETRQPFFRSLRSASSRERACARAQTELISLLVTAVERHVRLPRVDFPDARGSELNSQKGIESIAQRVRSAWNLETGPVPDVIAGMERHGIVTARFPVNTARLDAFSVRFARPVVVLGADKNAADRSRFDAAHELGHMVMHEHSAGDHKIIESQANMFAAAFLMPATQISDELPRRLDWRMFVDLKARWRVSIATLLRRANTLGLISKSTYIQGIKYMSSRGWRQREPGDIGPAESPVLLQRAVSLLEEGGTSLQTLATENGLPVDLLMDFLGASSDSRPVLEL